MLSLITKLMAFQEKITLSSSKKKKKKRYRTFFSPLYFLKQIPVLLLLFCYFCLSNSYPGFSGFFPPPSCCYNLILPKVCMHCFSWKRANNFISKQLSLSLDTFDVKKAFCFKVKQYSFFSPMQDIKGIKKLLVLKNDF